MLLWIFVKLRQINVFKIFKNELDCIMLINKHNLCFFDCKNAYLKTIPLKKWSVYCTDSFLEYVSTSKELETCGDICFKSIIFKPLYVGGGRWWQWRERSWSSQAKDLLPWIKGPSLTEVQRWRAGSCLSRWNGERLRSADSPGKAAPAGCLPQKPSLSTTSCLQHPSF